MLYTIAHVQGLKNEIRLRPGSNFAFDNSSKRSGSNDTDAGALSKFYLTEGQSA